MKIGDQSVYPTHTVYQDCGIDGNSGPHLTETIQNGMTLRQYYAGLAMQGVWVDLSDSNRPQHFAMVAASCVAIADALLAELEKQNDQA